MLKIKIKQHALTLIIGLAFILILLGGIVALSHAASAATVAPVHHSLADVDPQPPGH